MTRRRVVVPVEVVIGVVRAPPDEAIEVVGVGPPSMVLAAGQTVIVTRADATLDDVARAGEVIASRVTP
jgi:hypothetical protein